MADLSVCFVNYNSDSYLAKCLASIKERTTGLDYELIIIDNDSSDSSLEQAVKAAPEAKVLRNYENLGFAKALNQGIKQSSGRHILSLNNDILLRNNALKIMVDFMDSHPEAGACGGKLLNKRGKVQNQCKRGFPTPWNIFTHILGLDRLYAKNKYFAGYLMTYLDSEKINEVDALSGACLLVRKEMADKTGGMDEDYFLYGEDIDLCYRIKNSGWKVFYVPQAEFLHYGEKGSRANKNKRIYEYYRSMFIFYHKHYRHKYFFIINWLVYVGILIKALIHFAKIFLYRKTTVGSRK